MNDYPKLLINRKEAIRLFKDRIYKAMDILNSTSNSTNDSFEKLKDGLEDWDNYNVLLLKKVFSDKTISEQYQRQRKTLGPAREYWLDEVKEYRADLKNKIKNFEKMIEMVELFDEDDKIIEENKKVVEKNQTKNVNETKSIGLSAEIFWTILSISVGGAFALGVYFGQAKFDKEKSDYYEQVKILKVDKTNLQKSIVAKNSTIRQKEFQISVKKDSIHSLEENLNNLYLLLAKYSRDKN
ncbi:hypothetical protein EOD40_08995 [Flavobacterium sufflavum]|uniref:Uncharacterized protein n=1 Tax=Flavobacterium sufflavum TaxID=1921138 RepID=A0A3S2XIJ8_9FLAO|nr:hypothetical protein [Flavobacterium sufflavum]RVT76629.1 hypothetical protein EOD40_08995 [Flavobacterium sufflavum]